MIQAVCSARLSTCMRVCCGMCIVCTGTVVLPLGIVLRNTVVVVALLAVTIAAGSKVEVHASGNMSAREAMRAVVASDGACDVVEREIPAPSAGEVLVRVHAVGINRADTLQRRGGYAPPPGATDILGLEFAGTVVRVGPDCVREVARASSRVMGIVSGGGYAEFVVVHESLLLPIPDGMEWESAAAIPEVWLTAYQLLRFVADVQPGDSVLVHAAGSGVGTAAIQLCRSLGARSFAVAGTDEKIAVARELGAEGEWNYRQTPRWSESVREMTEGKGVDVILDCVGGSNWEQNADAIASEGRWVLFGLLGGAKVDGPLLGALLRKRVRLEGTTLRPRSLEYKGRLTASFADTILPSFSDSESSEGRRMRPIVHRSWRGLESAQEAHEYMESNANIGKLVLLLDDRDGGAGST